MYYIFTVIALLFGLAFTAQASTHAPAPNGDAAATPAESDAQANRRKAALRAALLEQQAQQIPTEQKQGNAAQATHPWTAHDRAELRQQIRQQSRGNSRP